MDFPNFGTDKNRLLKTLARYDGNVSVNDASEDVTDSRSKNKIYARHYHTFFLHILLENVCNNVEPDDQRREILFKEVCKRLSESKFLNESLVLDNLQPLRKKISEKFFNFVKQIRTKIIPDSTDISIASNSSFFLDECNFYPELDLQYKYVLNFEELEVIAKGGFGVVCKAKHKVTDIVYAVKKIIFKYKSDAEYLKEPFRFKYLNNYLLTPKGVVANLVYARAAMTNATPKVIREAKNIAALNHPNIVSYNNAWIECLPLSECETVESGSSSSESTGSDCSDSEFPEDPLSLCSKAFQAENKNEENPAQIASSVPDNWIKESILEESEILSESFSFLSINTQTQRQRSASDSTVLKQKRQSASDSQSNQWAPNYLNVRVMLCIQMEYCICDLRLWLERRAEEEELPFHMDVPRIFQDILTGVAHIHSKNIIHRDLKPQNIFFSEASSVLKIGDFGLATLSSCASDTKKGKIVKNHSANLGTVPYAAPEQIKGTLYDSKVDIYSLGIVLFELLNIISTKMEFSKAIEEILKGHFPREMETKWPVYPFLVKNMVSPDPKDRMSASEILNQLQNVESPEAKEILFLKSALSEKEDEIIRLRALVEEQKNIINRLSID